MLEKEFEKAKQAYVYGLPVVGMYEGVYKQVIDHHERKTDWNEFLCAAEVSPEDNALYGTAFVDLRHGPVVVSAPATDVRDYVLTFVDGYSNVIENIDSVFLDTEPRRFLLVGPEETILDYEGFDAVYQSLTSIVEVTVGVYVEDEDVEAAIAYMSEFDLPQLEASDKEFSYPVFDISTPKNWFKTLTDVLALSPELDDEADVLFDVRETMKYSEETLTAAISESVKRLEEVKEALHQDYFLRAVEWLDDDTEGCGCGCNCNCK